MLAAFASWTLVTPFDLASRCYERLAKASASEMSLHVIFNMSESARTVAVPSLAGCCWHRAVDTALPSPQDIAPPERQAVAAGDHHYVAQPRSVVVLEAH